MNKMKYLAIAAVFFCGMALFPACSGSDDIDSDVVPEPEEPVELLNREVLISHIESDAKLLADNIDSESFNASSQAFAQLLALIDNNKNFIPNMRSLFSAVSQNKSLLNLYTVVAGSELARMGYQAYIIADNGGFGVQVVFDEKGNCRINASDHLEFIFPANVSGFGTTLFKLVVKYSEDCYLSVADANIKNVKYLACVSRLPKSITMTLSGLIDNKEQKLSESIINLELPQKENSEYVNFDSKSFKISGTQSNYLNATDKSALNYSLTTDDKQMILNYGYVRNSKSITSCNAEMTLRGNVNFISQMAQNAIIVADLKNVFISFLDDLRITGVITDGKAFSESFLASIMERQQSSSADALSKMAESINNSSQLQITCDEMTMPEELKFCVAEENNYYLIEPALKDLNSDELIPLSQFVDQQTKDSFAKLFNYSFTPSGSASGSVLKFYSVLIQIMPLSTP